MSHYSTVRTHLVSAKHLTAALDDLGLSTVEVYAQPEQLVGFFDRTVEQRGHVIVRKQHAGTKADIGFLKGEDGRFELLIDSMDRPLYDGRWVRDLHKRYAYRVAMDLLTQQGFDLATEEQDEDGTVRLSLRRMA